MGSWVSRRYLAGDFEDDEDTFNFDDKDNTETAEPDQDSGEYETHEEDPDYLSLEGFAPC